MPVYELGQVQWGPETTWGTPVAATRRLMRLVDRSLEIGDMTKVLRQGGQLGPSPEAVQVYQDAKFMVKVLATYEDLTYWWDALMGKANAGPAAGTGPLVYAHTAPQLSVPTSPRYQTVEIGPPGAQYRAAGGLLKDFTLVIPKMDVWTAAGDFLSKAASANAHTSLSDGVVNTIRTAETMFFVDAVGGSIGATDFSAALVSAELKVTTGRHLKPRANSLNPVDWGEGQWAATLKTRLEYSSAVKTILDAIFTAKVQRLVRLRNRDAASGATPSTISAVTNVTNPTITTGTHNLAPGAVVTIAGVVGATGVNGTWVVATVPSTTTFTIITSAPGVWSSGGTVTQYQRAVVIDLPVTLDQPGKLFDDEQGNAVIEVQWTANYDTGVGQWLRTFTTSTFGTIGSPLP